jgi:type I restriction enzyme M protein
MITGEIKGQVDKIWESFWTGGVSMTVIEQFTYLLFYAARRNTTA